ncbi:MAG: hypothetical protein ACYS8W_16050 [Planctomycetota bacterium]|jgi:hypothetical protein
MKNAVVVGIATFVIGLLAGILITGSTDAKIGNAGNLDKLASRLDRIEKQLDNLNSIPGRLGELELESARIASTTSRIQEETKSIKETIDPLAASGSFGSADADSSSRGNQDGPPADTDGEAGNEGKSKKNLADAVANVVRVAAGDAFTSIDPEKMEENFYNRLQKKLDLTESQVLDMKDLYAEKSRRFKEIMKSKDLDEDEEDGHFRFGFSKEKMQKIRELDKWLDDEAARVLTSEQHEKFKDDPMLQHGPPSAGGMVVKFGMSIDKDEDEEK